MEKEDKKQPSTITLDPKVEEVYKLLKLYADDEKRDEWVTRYERAWEVIENKILTDKDKKELKKQDQEPLEINECVLGVQGACAIVTDQKPEIKVYPIGSGDLYVAELIKRGHDFVWERNQGSDVTYEVVEQKEIGGLAFFEVKFDRNLGFPGRIVFEESPPEDIYFDSTSLKRDFSDTPIIKAKERTVEYAKGHYPDLSEDDIAYRFDLKDSPSIRPKSKGLTSGDQYAEMGKAAIGPAEDEEKPKTVWEIEAHLLKTEEQDQVVLLDPEGKKEPEIRSIELTPEQKKGLEPGDLIEGQGVYHPRTVEKRLLRIIVGKKLIEETENPHGVDRDGNPIMSIVGLKAQKTTSAYPMSSTYYAMEINRDMIKRRLQYNFAISQNANSPIIEPAGAVDWEGTPGTPGSRALVSKNARFPVTRLEAGATHTLQFLEAEERDKANINDQYKLQDVMKGKIPQGTDPSGRLVLALQDFGGMMSKPSLRALEAALVRLAKANIAMMLRNWLPFMWKRLIEPDEWNNWQPEDKAEARPPEELSLEDQKEIHNKWVRALEEVTNTNLQARISVMGLDIKIVAGSSMPTNRIAKSMMAMEKLKVGMYDVEAALEYDDDPNKDRIAKRMKAREEAAMTGALLKK